MACFFYAPPATALQNPLYLQAVNYFIRIFANLL
jgi:hypothetical protein